MFHNNFDLKYKKPFGAIKQGTKTYFRIDVDYKYNYCNMRLWTAKQNEIVVNMQYNEEGYYETELLIDCIGLNWYFFILGDNNGSVRFYGCDYGYTAGTGIETSECPHNHSFQITCYDKDFSVPDWFKGRIMYQIFPDRFNRDKSYEFNKEKYNLIHENWNEQLGCTRWGADNFEYYGGNIRGITQKLDYLKSLNIGVIYLNPIFKAKSNHRYDVSTYTEIDEMLGLTEDFKILINECHNRDIKVVLDVSWNHVGDDSLYFNKYKHFGEDGAYNNRYSNYRNWFNIHDNGTYDCWWGFDSLPVVNKNDPTFRKHVQDAVKYWGKMGIDGWRLDVIDELPDNFLINFREMVHQENKNMVIFGEVWSDATQKKGFDGKFRKYLYGNSQDTVMNYVIRNLLVDFVGYGYREKEVMHNCINSLEFTNGYMNLLNNYPLESLQTTMNFLSTHDINRILTVFAGCPYSDSLNKNEQGKFVIPQDKYDLAVKRFKLAWSFLICFIGNPSLFYGDETGLYGYNDPYNRKQMNWNSIDNNLLDWVRSINEFRNIEILKTGNIKPIYIEDPDVIAFKRFDDKCNEILYIMNRSDKDKIFFIDDIQYRLNPLSYKII